MDSATDQSSQGAPVASNRWCERGLMLLMVCAPTLAVLALIRWKLGASLGEFEPAWNDELGYWHEALSFASRGWDSGQYSFAEAPARAAFSPFGTHGPVLAVLWGMVGRLVGWKAVTPVLFNMLSLIAGSAWVAMGVRNRGLVAAVLCTFWPMLLYVPSAMQETFHCAVALVLAGGLMRVLESTATRSTIVITSVVLVIASLMRSTWAFVALPWIWMLVEERPFRVRALWLGCGLVFVLVCVLLGMWWSAPYGLAFLPQLTQAWGQDIGKGLALFWAHFCFNWHALTIGLPFDHLLEKMFRLQVLVVLIAGSVIAWRAGRVWKVDDWLPLVLLVPMVVVVTGFYDVHDWRFCRTMAPVLLIVLLVLAARGHRTAVLLAAAVSLAGGPAFVTQFAKTHTDHFLSPTGSGLFQERYGSRLTYDPAAGRWGNALLVTSNEMGPYMAAVPAGIGIGFALEWKHVKKPWKSRYIFMSEKEAQKPDAATDLKLLVKGEMGNLYENPQWQRPVTGTLSVR